jgi:hypothetical protein
MAAEMRANARPVGGDPGAAVRDDAHAAFHLLDPRDCAVGEDLSAAVEDGLGKGPQILQRMETSPGPDSAGLGRF